MKILITVFLFISQFQSSFSQESILSTIINVSRNADSVIRLINSKELIEKKVQGSVEPFSEVSGIAFLDEEHTEILKMQLTSLGTQAVVTYYCSNNVIQVICTPQASYYRHDNEWVVFHFLKETELLTQKQLQSQDVFMQNITMVLIRQ